MVAPHNIKLARFACLVLFVAVALGAFGAHGLKERVLPAALETWKTGNLYHFIHGGALLAYALTGLKDLAPKLLFLIGILIFSGGCYLYTLTGLKFFGLIVPIGGVSFLAGWLTFWHALGKGPAA